MWSLAAWTFLSVGSVASAKVSDFNALIGENIAAQKQLHREVRGGMVETRAAVDETPASDSPIVIEAKGNDINVPTNQRFLRFKKEIVDHRVSEKTQQKRIANEMKSGALEY